MNGEETAGKARGAPDLQAEIAKYTEMLAQDPQSRVFALLAEALRKSGDFDEAIRVAEEGLRTHAHYLSGRMALARAFYDKGEFDKAREEFERVITAAPDNLLAHKHLSEIYLSRGDKAGAAKSLKMVVLLNPADQEARARLASIAPDAESRAEAPAASEFVLETHRYEEEVSEGEPPSPPPSPDGFETLLAGGAAVGEEDAGEREEVHAAPEGFEGTTAPPEEEQFEEEFSLEGPEEPASEEAPAELGPAAAEEETALPAGFETAFAEAEEALAEAEEIPFEKLEILTDQEMLQQPEIGEEEPGAVAPEAAEETGGWEAVMEELTADERAPGERAPGELDTQTLADLYTQQGFYDKARDIYGKILQQRPDDAHVKQKLEELESLARLSRGREEEPAAPETTKTAETAEAPEAAGGAPPQGAKAESHALETLRQWLDRIKKERG